MSARPKRGSGAPAPLETEATPALGLQALLEEERARQAAVQLAATQPALEALSVEHEALQAARRHEGREAAEVAAHHRQLMAEKDAQLAAAQAGAAAAEARLAEAQAAAEQREAALAAAAAAEAALLQQAAAGLQAKLDGLAEFATQRESLLAELQRLRAEKAAAAEEAGEKIRALQRRLHEAEHRTDAGSSGAGEDADADGGDALYAEGEVHRLLAHSRKAAAEMERYGQEAEALQREMKALEGERAGLLRDVALRQEMEAQYAKRGTLQAREIRSARTKITSLEKGLVRMAADFEQEKAALEQQLRAQLADAVAEQNSLRRLLQVRTRELRQVRRLAQQVLLQRSEVEAFLVSSIQLVRTQMAAEAAGAPSGAAAGAPGAGAIRVGVAPSVSAEGGAGGGGGDPLHQPELSGMAASGAPAGSSADTSATVGSCAACEGAAVAQHGSPSSCAAAGPTAAVAAATGAPAVDIRALSWQDRERVLRLLFAKINRAAAQPLARPPAEAAPVPPLRGLATEAGPAGLA